MTSTEPLGVGAQLERLFRVLAFLLNAWCSVHDTKRSGRMRAVEFDKLAAFTQRLWNELFDRLNLTGGVTDHPVRDDTERITFRSPLTECMGRHGRGLARQTEDQPPRFLLDILFSLQRERILDYFDIRTPAVAPHSASHFSTTVGPSPLAVNRSKFLDGFSRLELRVLKELADSIRKLSPSEIRALGTHTDRCRAIADIRFLLGHIVRHLNAVSGAVANNLSFGENSRLFLACSDEVVMKSGGNRSAYESARRRLLSGLHDTELLKAFEETQEEARQIWDCSEMHEFTLMGKRLQATARYTWAISYFQEVDNPRMACKTGRGKHLSELGQEGVRYLRRLGLSWPSPSFWDTFVPGTNTIPPTARQRIATGLEKECEQIVASLASVPP